MENEILRLMAWAQASLGEVTLFDEKLVALIAKLDACLKEKVC